MTRPFRFSLVVFGGALCLVAVTFLLAVGADVYLAMPPGTKAVLLWSLRAVSVGIAVAILGRLAVPIHSRRFQFSLRALFVLMLAVACLFAGIRCLYASQFWSGMLLSLGGALFGWTVGSSGGYRGALIGACLGSLLALPMTVFALFKLGLWEGG